MTDRFRCAFPTCLSMVGILALVACASPSESPADEVAEDGISIGRVEVSNDPLAFMVERLGAPLLEVGFRAAAVPEPALWRPTAEDVLALQEADLIVLNGASYESWIDTVSLPSSRIVDTSAGFRDRLIRIAGTVTHSHGLEGEHAHSGTAFTTWLDPTLAIEQARAIRDALIARWPEHRGLFEDRFVELEEDLIELDGALAGAVGEGAGRPVLFSHPVYQYLERRYGLVGRSVHWEPDVAPDEAAWDELQALLAEHPARFMVWEAEPLRETAERLAAMGVESVVVEPCGNPPAQGDFLDAMRRNVAALREVYRGDPSP